MVKRPTESDGEPSSSNCRASAGVKVRHLPFSIYFWCSQLAHNGVSKITIEATTIFKKLFLICGVLASVAGLSGCAATSSIANATLTTEEFRVASDPGIQVYVRNKRPAGMTQFSADKTVIYVHGATYPSETAFDLPLDGLSWMDYIAKQGYDVYLLDVRGYAMVALPAPLKWIGLPLKTRPSRARLKPCAMWMRWSNSLRNAVALRK